MEQVHLQLRPALGKGVVFQCQFAAYLVHVVQRLLQRGEEPVQVILVGIDTVALFSFRLDVKRPPAAVILHHLHLLELRPVGLSYGCGGIDGGERLK